MCDIVCVTVEADFYVLVRISHARFVVATPQKRVLRSHRQRRAFFLSETIGRTGRVVEQKHPIAI